MNERGSVKRELNVSLGNLKVRRMTGVLLWDFCPFVQATDAS